MGRGTAQPWLIPPSSASKKLCHTNVKTTQIYARITGQKVNYDMEKLSEKLNGKHPEPSPRRTQSLYSRMVFI